MTSDGLPAAVPISHSGNIPGSAPVDQCATPYRRWPFGPAHVAGLASNVAVVPATSQPTWPKTTSVFSSEPRTEACQAEESGITGLAFTHGLWITACDFYVGLRGSVDQFIFIKYIGDIDFPLFTVPFYES